jgi:hypothetical protein
MLALLLLAVSVSGIVTDPAGLPVAGAEVIADGRRVVTSAEGKFNLPDLRGRITVEVRAPGFANYTRTVDTARERNLRVQLEIGALASEVTVSDTAPVVEPPAAVLDTELLDQLPVLDGDVLGAATALLDNTGFGEPTVIVDGVETREPVRASSIKEVRIAQSGYSAEYSRPGSSRIEIVTKRGSDEFHGDVDVLFRDYRLDARNAFAAFRPEQTRQRIEGEFTGPLGRSKKHTFEAEAEVDSDNEQAVVFAIRPDGIVQANAPQPEREIDWGLRVNRYHSDRHRFSIRYSGDRTDMSGLGAGDFVLPEAAYRQTERSHRFGFEHHWFAGPNFFTALSLRSGRYRDTSVSLQPAEPRIVVREAFTAGGAQQDNRSTRYSTELSYAASVSAGKHTVRTGVQVPDFERYRLTDLSNFGGTFVFASLADWELRRPLSFTQNTGTGQVAYTSVVAAVFVQDEIRLRRDASLSLGVRYEWQRFARDADNIQPRIGLAWRAGGITFRAGAGVFHDRVPGSSIFDSLRFDGIRLRQVLTLSPPFPDPGTGLEQLAPNIVRLSAGLRSPRLVHVGASAEKKINNALTVGATWSIGRGSGLLRSIDRNAPLPPTFVRPMTEFGILEEIEPSGRLATQSLALNARINAGRRVRAGVMYSLGRVMNHADGPGNLPPDSLDLSREWARAGFDRRHRFRMFGTVAFPAKFALGTIFEAGSGRPYEWTTGRDLNRDSIADERPAGIFRNALEGPGEAELDVRLSREFALRPGEDAPELTVSLDAFNALNRVNYSRIAGNELSPFFGLPTSADNARRLQLSIGLSF